MQPVNPPFVFCCHLPLKQMPRVRIELTTFRLWDWRAACCANEARKSALVTEISCHNCHITWWVEMFVDCTGRAIRAVVTKRWATITTQLVLLVSWWNDLNTTTRLLSIFLKPGVLIGKTKEDQRKSRARKTMNAIPTRSWNTMMWWLVLSVVSVCAWMSVRYGARFTLHHVKTNRDEPERCWTESSSKTIPDAQPTVWQYPPNVVEFPDTKTYST